MAGALQVGENLLATYRDLLNAEARLGEALSRRGVHVGVSLVDQWPTLQEYLHLYARGLSAAGLLVLGGGPDEGSRHTGIPFTGAAEARTSLGLSAAGGAESPSGAVFWLAVERARQAAAMAPLEALFSTVHLALARPFDYPSTAPVRAASATHVHRLLSQTRPQAVVTVGQEALATLGLALRDPRLSDMAATNEAQWSRLFPPGTPMLRYPTVDVPAPQPFRMRVVPVPSLAGPSSVAAGETLRRTLAYALP